MNRKPLPAIASRAIPSLGCAENVPRLPLPPICRVPTLHTSGLLSQRTYRPPLKLPPISGGLHQQALEEESDGEMYTCSPDSPPYAPSDDLVTPELEVPLLDLTALTGCRPGSSLSYSPASSLGSSASSADNRNTCRSDSLSVTRCEPKFDHLRYQLNTSNRPASPGSFPESTDRRLYVPQPPVRPKPNVVRPPTRRGPL